MTRYVTRARWADDISADILTSPTITVHEADDFVDTGILDRHGIPLYRTDKVKMGIQIVKARG